MNRLLLYALALLVLVCDQATKLWMARTFPLGGSRDYGPFFALSLAHNTGGAFSILPNATWGLAAAALVAAGVIIVYTLRARGPLPRLLGFALALPLGGALGNLLDRVRLGYVVDFLDVHARGLNWPVFNVADSAICVGVALLAIYFWRASPSPTARPAEEKL